MQQTVILWLAALPLVLAMFRAITIGDKLYAPVQTGTAGGHHKQLVNAVLAGSSILTLLVIPVVAGLGGNISGVGALENTIALVVMSFGAFIASAYLAAGFRGKTWQKFIGHVFHEAGLYWLVLGVCSLVLLIADRPPASANAPVTGPALQFLELATWGVISTITIGIVVGTASRMIRR